ncbi:MAG: TIGR01777 family protein [Polyangiaceae bacterium]|nr:TIGR01777 family protein [Polyangiaceae bacterium]
MAPGGAIAVSGASGMVGRAIVSALEARGDRVVRLVRRPAGEGEVEWHPDRGELASGALSGVRAVIHLAGESIASGRWTEDRKRRIETSRTTSTSLLARAVADHPDRPALICAAAIGIYGPDHGDAWLDETSSEDGAGFLAEVCRAWEAAAEPARRAGVRTAHLRLGVVLSKEGGALAKLLPVFRLGGGGKVGSGNQYMSWVAIDDVVRAFLFVLDRDDLSGPFNVVAPRPVSNRDFTKALATALGRPAIVPVPALALKLALGEMATETILASQRVRPTQLVDAGFTFSYPEIETAIQAVLRD